jgi:hypothetical protein
MMNTIPRPGKITQIGPWPTITDKRNCTTEDQTNRAPTSPRRAWSGLHVSRVPSKSSLAMGCRGLRSGCVCAVISEAVSPATYMRPRTAAVNTLGPTAFGAITTAEIRGRRKRTRRCVSNTHKKKKKKKKTKKKKEKKMKKKIMMRRTDDHEKKEQHSAKTCRACSKWAILSISFDLSSVMSASAISLKAHRRAC